MACRSKRRRANLVVLGIPLISFQVLFFYRLLTPSALNVVDLSDWTRLMVESSQHRQQHSRVKIQPSGTFNGYPIYYQSPATTSTDTDTTPVQSQFHCIGETNAEPYFWKRKRQHVDMTWASRSCHFQFLCLDLETHEFALYLNQQQRASPNTIDPRMESQQTVFFNQSADGHPYGVAMGGINAKWTHAAFPRLKWFPTIHYNAPPTHFYTLPSNVTMIPFHSLAAFNPGHLVWDDFLPIYTLLQIFGLQDTTEPLLIRYQLPGEDGLWAGCDWKGSRTRDCEFMLNKFGPLMVRRPEAIPITTQTTVRLQLFDDDQDAGGPRPKSNLVCARHALAGIGALTDHGVEKGHGWEQRDYETMYNHGRGGQLWKFRNFLLDHLQLNLSTTTTTTNHRPRGPPYRIVFSERSSDMGHRSLDFTQYVNVLKTTPELRDVDIIQVQMKDLTLTQQAELVGEAAIYVTGCGGGAVTATFLPRGASILVFYSEFGGVENSRPSGKPARLDWDYFNNMAYVRVHWVTQPRSRQRILPAQLSLVTELVIHEMEVIRGQQPTALDKP